MEHEAGAAGRFLVSPSFRSVVDAAPVAVMVTEARGCFVYANRSAEDLLGYDHGGVAGRHVGQILPAGQEWPPVEPQALESGATWNGHVIVRRLNGDFMRLAVNMWALNGAGRACTAYVSMAHPIEDRDGARRALRRPAGGNPTARDLTLLQLMAEGFDDEQIASLLGVSPWTVNEAAGLAMTRLNARSRTQACIEAIKAGLIV